MFLLSHNQRWRWPRSVDSKGLAEDFGLDLWTALPWAGTADSGETGTVNIKSWSRDSNLGQAKRPAREHEPKHYLEPKWLRYF